MKKIHAPFKYLILIGLLLPGIIVQAQKKKYEFAKDRAISQTYSAGSGDKLSIENQFGDVVIKTWSKNEVKVDVKIEVSSNLKEDADEMYDRIDVKHGKEGNSIYFKTIMNKNEGKAEKKKQTGSHSNTISINYEVSMPANLVFDLANKFGKTTVPDYQGKIDIDQQFGDLVTGKLSQPGKVVVKFGSATIENASNGKFDFQFVSNAAIIKNATGALDINVQHCKNNGVIIYAANASAIEVDAQHSDVAIVLPKDASANFSVDTHFGSFKNNSSFAIKQQDDAKDDKKHGPRFNHSYTGTSGQGKAKINLDGNFTEFTITHEAPTMKEKKEKTKTVRI